MLVISLSFTTILILIRMYYERFPYKEEVTGSNPVAPTRVLQKSSKKIPINANNDSVFILLRIVSNIKFMSG